MTKLVVNLREKPGRPIGAVLAFLPNDTEFGKKETLENGFLKLKVMHYSKEELKQLRGDVLSYYEVWSSKAEKWQRLSSPLRAFKLKDYFVEECVEIAKIKGDKEVYVDIREILSATEQVFIPPFHTDEFRFVNGNRNFNDN